MKHNRIKTVIIFNSILASILLMIAGSFAAYTSLSSAKRVVSTVGAEQLFSSNVLTAYDSAGESLPSLRVISFGQEDSESNTFSFIIGNYAQGNKTNVSSKSIAYILKAWLLDSGDNKVTDTSVLSTYKLNDTVFSTDGITMNERLAGGTLDEDLYTVTIPYEYMSEYKILLTAKATNISSYSEIGRVVSTTTTVASSHWTGSFLQNETAQEAGELAAVNVRIQGTEQETMVIKWNTNYVEIDPWFLEDISKYTIVTSDSPDSDRWKTLKIKVGETGQPNQYSFTFYRTRSFEPGKENWNDIRGYITFSYE